MHKPMGALKVAEDAIIVDTTNLSIDEVKEKVEKIILEKINKKRGKYDKKNICFFLHLACIIYFNLKIVGKENVPKEGAYILCANHKSNWDPPLVVSSIKRKNVCNGKTGII